MQNTQVCGRRHVLGKMDAGKSEKIRLIGVDTPEVKWEGLTEEQPGGKEAL
ncbi:endonuclease YncB(thermonuclease family) [Algoriphagus sp. 4150]|uniref:hypothetical protein n=1 Tax=Algoriphagus sp. 4150 TaxID=2817756 RepID=UPI002858D4EA|nr:hypothetical protein [Algoriphagus sp. 4150]MDR7130979.1 endonuclease YncB(thermonuclease family) [Algoriphagus sp. 4150]